MGDLHRTIHYIDHKILQYGKKTCLPHWRDQDKHQFLYQMPEQINYELHRQQKQQNALASLTVRLALY